MVGVFLCRFRQRANKSNLCINKKTISDEYIRDKMCGKKNDILHGTKQCYEDTVYYIY